MKKLSLKRETLVALTDADTQQVAGGVIEYSVSCPYTFRCSGFSHLVGCTTTCPQ